MSIVPEQLCVAPNATDQAQIYNNQIYTQVSNFTGSGSVNTTTGAVVNVVPSTIFTTTQTITGIGSTAGAKTLFSVYPAYGSGIYKVDFNFYAYYTTAGATTDVLQMNMQTPTSNVLIGTILANDLANYNSYTGGASGVVVWNTGDTFTISVTRAGTSTGTYAMQIFPYVTVQKIG